MEGKPPRPNAQQWSHVRGQYLVEYEVMEEGRVALLVPRFRWGPLKWLVQPRLRKPFIRLKLDELGSFVWRRLDGEVRFSQLVEEMRQAFGSRIEPAEERLQQFLAMLANGHLVELFVVHDEKK